MSSFASPAAGTSREPSSGASRTTSTHTELREDPLTPTFRREQLPVRIRSKPSAENLQAKLCDACELAKTPLWLCSYCDIDFCDDCWDKQPQHREGRVAPDGLPHEKADSAIAKRLKDILRPSTDRHTKRTQTDVDEDTKWFGLGRNSQNVPVFQDYGLFSTIMAESDTGQFKSRYPSIVSFIGQTGTGKSTLIKMLIDQQKRRDSSNDWTLPSPELGIPATDGMPTSSDVHLYSDPRTYATEYPILYADCEGLTRETSSPSVRSLSQEDSAKTSNAPESHRRRLMTKRLRIVPRNIEWADANTSRRQYAVTELYPRLLYTFSDVVVFVFRDLK